MTTQSGRTFTQSAPQQTAAAAAASTIIAPSVGRIVWFYPTKDTKDAAGKDIQPHAAIVAFVHDDRKVNLSVIDHSGVFGGGFVEIQLMQEGDPEPEKSHCRWMPYQLGQAKKHA